MGDGQPRRVSRLKNNHPGVACWVRGACDISGRTSGRQLTEETSWREKMWQLRARPRQKITSPWESGERGKREKVAVTRLYKSSYS